LELEAGTIVANRYRIIRPLGRGGMGEVFAAENVRTGRHVAVKLLRADSKTKSSAVARFRREARAAGSIISDHVTQVLDVEDDPEHGIVLVFELLSGESLIDRLKRTGPIAFEELHAIVEQVWLGLADAHREGIIHRDLKPSNVFLEQRPDGSTRVKILDFGISKVPKEMGGETLTEMGQSLGTFSFMPPEQINKAKTVDHRADIYACSTLIYQALTGQLPYQARNILAMVELKTKTEPRKLSDVMEGAFDPRLEAFLAKGLARDPAQRFQTAIEGLTAWRELRPGSPISQSNVPSSVSAVPSSSAMSAPGSSHQRMQTPTPPGGTQNPATSSHGLSSYGAPPSPRSGGQMPPHGAMPPHSTGPLSPHSAGPMASHARLPAQTPPRGALSAAVPPGALMQPPQAGALSTPMPQPTGAGQGQAAPNVLASTASDMAATVARPPNLDRELVPQTVREPQGSAADAQRSYAGGGYEQIAQPGRRLGPQGTARFDQGMPASIPAQTAAPYTSSGGYQQLPRIYDESSTGPPSQEKTQVYRPQHGGAPTTSPEPGPALTPAEPTRPRPPVLLYVIAVVAFALVGFVVVAFLLRYRAP
jgi:serine/threonine-protein kinase